MNNSFGKLCYKLTGSKRFIGLPYRFSYLNKQPVPTEPFYFLDIGCGNHSATTTKKFFPDFKYYGLDFTRDYANDDNDFKLMDGFYEVNLETSDLSLIPDGMFDYINLSHLIEHIQNHEIMLKRLVKKLKKGGVMYMEYPNWRSTKLPSMYQSLNFFDDDTHVHIHSNRDLANLLMKEDMQVIKMGTRRSLFEIVFIPVRVLESWVKGQRLRGGIFWSLFGFADYIILKKK